MSESSTPTPEATPASDAAPEAAKQETFSRDYVEALRNEAANYRNKAKTAADEARAAVIKDYEAKFAEKDTAFAELKAAHDGAARDLLRIQKVLEAKVPIDHIEDVLPLIAGDTEEAISESVARVKSLLEKTPASVPAVDTTQGKGGAIPLNGNPVLDMLKAAVGAS
ncbi:MAG: hypothetical protein ACXWOV_00145 [Isosphaeraceae bacterium]